MKREELYEKVMEISEKYHLPVRINKKTKKKELQKMFDNMSKLSQNDELINDESYIDDDIKDLLDEYKYNQDEGDDSNEGDEEYETKIEPINEHAKEEMKEEKPKRRIKSGRMQKILIKQSTNSLKKELNSIISKYNIETKDLFDTVEQIKDITPEEMNIIIQNYNEIREETENDINLSIDSFEGNIHESLYIWVEGLLDKKKRQLEKLI